jgi:hypothetical protein
MGECRAAARGGALARRIVGPVARRIPILLLTCGLAIAGCASASSNPSRSSGSSASTTPAASTTAAASGAQPAGALPSSQAKMICSTEAQGDIAASLGVTAKVSAPTWVDHVYACKYVYPGGMITLAVTELADEAHTTATFNAFATRLGRLPEIVTFGDGAFITTNDSVIVRKDFKVLDVDVSLLPPRFGRPPQDRSDVALSIAATVMECWPGS